MQKRYWLVLLLALALTLIILFPAYSPYLGVQALQQGKAPAISTAPSNFSYSTILQAPDGSKLYCQVASTEQEREVGLMYQSSMCPSCCMLFAFQDDGIHPFWMKNTLFPLDEVYLSPTYQVVDVYSNFQPCPADAISCPVDTPDADSMYTIEINAGQAAARNITVGTHVTPVG